MGATVPPSPLETAANLDNIRSAWLRQLGQVAASVAWVKERSNSNFALQLGH